MRMLIVIITPFLKPSTLWRRILESLQSENKFDADILAQVWGYKLLDVLDFENAVNKNLN